MHKFRISYYQPSFNMFKPRRSIVHADNADDAVKQLRMNADGLISEIVSVKCIDNN